MTTRSKSMFSAASHIQRAEGLDVYYLVTSSTSDKSIHSFPVEAAAELQRLSGHEFEDVDNEALREWLDAPYTTFAALHNWIEPIRFAG